MILCVVKKTGTHRVGTVLRGEVQGISGPEHVRLCCRSLGGASLPSRDALFWMEPLLRLYSSSRIRLVSIAPSVRTLTK